MNDVSIIYCQPCGYRKRADEASAAIAKELSVTATLVPGRGGIFEVRVGDNVVTKRSKGHFPDTAEIVAAVSDALGKGPAPAA